MSARRVLAALIVLLVLASLIMFVSKSQSDTDDATSVAAQDKHSKIWLNDNTDMSDSMDKQPSKPLVGTFAVVDADDQLVERMTFSEDGTLNTTTRLGEQCRGVYQFTKTSLRLEYQDRDNASGAGCANYNAEFELAQPLIDELKLGESAPITMRSVMDYSMPKRLFIKRES